MKKLILLLLLISTPLFGAEIIGNKSPYPSEMSIYDLDRIFKLKQRQWEGLRVKVFSAKPGGRLFRDFAKRTMHMRSSEYELYIKLIEANAGGSVAIMRSEMETVRFVRKTLGGIGYIGSGILILNTDGKDVKVIDIIE